MESNEVRYQTRIAQLVEQRNLIRRPQVQLLLHLGLRPPMIAVTITQKARGEQAGIRPVLPEPSAGIGWPECESGF